MDYISIREAAQKWEISERRVQKLCEESRIDGIQKFGRSWMIPKTAQKPEDIRRKYKKVIETKKGGDRNV